MRRPGRWLEAGVLLGAMAAGAVLFQAPRAHACDCVWWNSEEVPLTLVASQVDGVAQPLPAQLPRTGLRADYPGSGGGGTVVNASLYDPATQAARCARVEAQR